MFPPRKARINCLSSIVHIDQGTMIDGSKFNSRSSSNNHITNITDHRIKYSSIFIIHHVITIQSPPKKKWSTTYFTIIILTNIYFVNIFMQM